MRFDVGASEFEIVKKLVLERHINVPERRSLPEGKAKGSLIFQVIEDTIREKGRYPFHIKPGEPYQGGIIERLGLDEYIVHWQAEVSLSRFATVKKEYFSSLQIAMQSFVEKEWPDGIDAVAIDWSK